ncbi:Aste57867_15324 [Aphanomyces stellatus]|uniref:Aste57867_15324 protein n=1 Tax=Aphanomyces stellatus TaxID=120398 RepID=A0A485L3G8_9STRA|nr:hypothetical protein As57867_015268 [Aphanomyces stellatus]VFT92133.1 Aste57867_15324 [Aphanomyces stellatus]
MTRSGESKRATPYQAKHGVTFGLRIHRRDSSTDEVISVQCLFCIVHGREQRDGMKRKTIGTVKAFQPPYRPENYRHHNETQHPTLWKHYQALSSDEQLVYFTAHGTPSCDDGAAAQPPTASLDAPIVPVSSMPPATMDHAKEACDKVQSLRDALGDRYYAAVDLLTDAGTARAFLVVADADRLGWLDWRMRRPATCTCHL